MDCKAHKIYKKNNLVIKWKVLEEVKATGGEFRLLFVEGFSPSTNECLSAG